MLKGSLHELAVWVILLVLVIVIILILGLKYGSSVRLAFVCGQVQQTQCTIIEASHQVSLAPNNDDGRIAKGH